MTLLAILISGVLVGISALHALWGMGKWVPIADEAELARAFVGARGVTRMPGPIPCFLVVAALVMVTVLIWLPPGGLRDAILGLAAAVLILRGGLAYTRLWRRMTPEEPFARYDRTRYGPLCLALGAGLAILIVGGN
ncbi:DUF3995 domain-containing protein [Yoonia sp. SS1-5]|uniref:DUF3995 domain-containing protein n=1 Tax=Yoonia rhodophyticola TaxID=3137370 RepID=A0AAN0NKG7_9RHOB